MLQAKGFSVMADLNNPADWPRLVAEAAERMGGIDVLVHSGGAMSNDMLQHVRILQCRTLRCAVIPCAIRMRGSRLQYTCSSSCIK